MNPKKAVPELAGSTLRFTFTDGPTRGKTYEHMFSENGTVSFRDVDGAEASGARGANGKAAGAESKEAPRYGAFRVGDHIQAISYLASNGYTLTVVLDSNTGELQGFASNDKEWYQLHGTFEVVSNVPGV